MKPWLDPQHTMGAILALERSGEEDQKFKVILRELGIWYTQECLKNQTNKTKTNQTKNPHHKTKNQNLLVAGVLTQRYRTYLTWPRPCDLSSALLKQTAAKLTILPMVSMLSKERF